MRKIATSLIVILFVMALVSNFSMIQDAPVKAQPSPSIEVWNETTILDAGDPGYDGGGDDSPNVRFPGITVAPNGDFVCVFKDDEPGYDSCCYGWINCTISSDNGSTWSTPFNIAYRDIYYHATWSLITAPNGDLLFLGCNTTEYPYMYNGTDIWRNTENGSEGNWTYDGNFSEWQKCYVYDWFVWGYRIYCYVNDPGYFVNASDPQESFIGYSDDNGSTWSKLNNGNSNRGGEWSAIPTNENASNWTLVCRTLLGDSSWNGGTGPTTHCGYTGPGDPYAYYCEQYYTTDAWQTWTELNRMCPDYCNDERCFLGTNHYNKGNKLMWLDDQTIMMCNERYDTPSGQSGLWFNNDNLSFDAWSDWTTLGYEGANNGTNKSNPRNAYCRAVALPKRDGDVGGWAYVVWSEVHNNRIMGAYVANNATIVWEEPPGPLDGDFSGGGDDGGADVQFLYIEGGGNGTIVNTGTPVFNWTMDVNASVYQLQIDNDSDWSSLEVNLSDICEWIYPSEFDANATRVSFQLPVSESLSEDYYYCRVRAYG